MGQIQFSDGLDLPIESRHMILDSGVSYALIPSQDFKQLTEILEKKYEVVCKSGVKKDNFSAQVDPSDCQCLHYDKIPNLNIKLL